MSSMEPIEDIIKNATDTMVKQAPDLDPNHIASMFKDYFEKGTPFYKSMGLSEDFIKFLYASAYQSYMSGQYEKALAAFMLLHTYDPAAPEYILGKALCYKDMNKPSLAINEFLRYATLNPENPEIYWNMYECFTQIDEQFGAASSLGAVLYLCDKNQSHPDLKNKAELALVKISDQMAADDERLQNNNGSV